MKKFYCVLFFLLSQSSLASPLKYPLLGVWDQNDPRFDGTVSITPLAFQFSDCGPVEVLQSTQEDRFNSNTGLIQRHYQMQVIVRYPNSRVVCLDQGYHDCEMDVNQWGLEANSRYLMIYCEHVFRVYERDLR